MGKNDKVNQDSLDLDEAIKRMIDYLKGLNNFIDNKVRQLRGLEGDDGSRS